MQNDVQKQLIDDLAHLCDELAPIPSCPQKPQSDSVARSHSAACAKASNTTQPATMATPHLTESDQCVLPLT